MASSALLATHLDANYRVCWTYESAAPASRDLIFEDQSAQRTPDEVGIDFIDEEELTESTGLAVQEFPPYLQISKTPRGGSVLTLAGLDRGEQPFMSELSHLISDTQPEFVVISAGGRFSIQHGSDSVTWDDRFFRTQRCEWYGRLRLNAEIDSVWPELAGLPSLGLHLRYSDRSHQTPSRSEIRRACLQLGSESGISRIFVAGDSYKENERWLEELEAFGFNVWSARDIAHFADGMRDGVSALVDWRTLSACERIVFFTESSFGYEAAVATGKFESSIGLSPNPLVTIRTRLGYHLSNIWSAPRRRGWIP